MRKDHLCNCKDSVLRLKMARTHIVTILFICIVISSLLTSVVQSGSVVCYYRYWAQYAKNPEAKFTPDKIDTNYCSVVNYAFFQVDLVTYKLTAKQRGYEKTLAELVALKRKRADLKIVISVGGWGHEKEPRFSSMAQTKERRKIFIESALKVLNDNRLDGLSLDWEYPTKRPKEKPDLIRKDEENLTWLLYELRQAFHQDRIDTNKTSRFYLTLAVPSMGSKTNGFDVTSLINYADWVNVMAYNLVGQWRRETGCPTSMSGGLNSKNVPTSINTWLKKKGLQANKINLGLAFYSRGYLLTEHSIQDGDFGVGAASIKDGLTPPGPLMGLKGVLSFPEICMLKWDRKTSSADSSFRVPYVSNSTNGAWASYEDQVSIRYKIESLVNCFGLRGISVWAIDFDDFNGVRCKSGNYPLLREAVKAINEGKKQCIKTSVEEEQYHNENV